MPPVSSGRGHVHSRLFSPKMMGFETLDRSLLSKLRMVDFQS